MAIYDWLNEPYATHGINSIWFLLMAFLVALPCSQLGSFLILRRMSLVGDAIGHGVLPGIVLSFMLVEDFNSPWMIVGATGAGMMVTFLIEMIHSKTRVKQDAAIGISFTTLFAIGVLMINLFLPNAHIDESCVVNGSLVTVVSYEQIDLLGLSVPKPILTMGTVAGITLVLMMMFYKYLLLSSFDEGLAASIGFQPRLVHYALMGGLSLVTVTSFQAVGSILVIALLIIPAASAYLCTYKLKTMLWLASLHALLSSIGGLYLFVHGNCSFSAAMVVAGSLLFVLAWLLGPVDGLVWKWKRRYLRAKVTT